MSKRRRGVLAVAGVLVITAVAVGAATARQSNGDRTQALKTAFDFGRAQNVILIIGDGMGASEITIARNYAYGAAGGWCSTTCRSPAR